MLPILVPDCLLGHVSVGEADVGNACRPSRVVDDHVNVSFSDLLQQKKQEPSQRQKFQQMTLSMVERWTFQLHGTKHISVISLHDFGYKMTIIAGACQGVVLPFDLLYTLEFRLYMMQM